MIHILLLFKRLGLINSFLLINTLNKYLLVKLSPFFYKNTPFFKGLRLVSTPSKRFNIKLRTLQILEKSLGETIVILETSHGIITHRDALRLKIGGKILFVLN
jgi:ribosomal protein S8